MPAARSSTRLERTEEGKGSCTRIRTSWIVCMPCEHDMLEAARRARLVRALEVASATESRPNFWVRARHQLARFAPHHRAPRRRIMPA
jgi:hypothetical protein